MNQQGLACGPKVYGNPAREYVACVADHSPASMLNATFGGGITASWLRDQVTFNMPWKGQMPVRSAFKQGFSKSAARIPSLLHANLNQPF